MSVFLAPFPRIWFGPAFAGYKFFMYAAGTLTKQSTFTDSTGATPNTNPIILDANGSASIWLTAGVLYKAVLALPTDTDPPTVPIWTQDNISIADSSGVTITMPGVNAVATTIGLLLAQQLWACPFNFMTAAQIADWISGAGAFDHAPFIQSAINTGNSVFLPAGSPTVKAAQINCANKGQIIFGAGRSLTFITIPARHAGLVNCIPNIT